MAFNIVMADLYKGAYIKQVAYGESKYFHILSLDDDGKNISVSYSEYYADEEVWCSTHDYDGDYGRLFVKNAEFVDEDEVPKKYELSAQKEKSAPSLYWRHCGAGLCLVTVQPGEMLQPGDVKYEY